ncbi:uncharacterized protein LY89DRAFT_734052 [Mollisia scopiformis]|uniref:Uncharacterized protein n=1 Tax=Mollisia scopiformis TaxID=149040 RepID=A0A194XA64_MOLSC|nr:uncharacterized protein LY89DRAFT_734052 [Mollisia scopiformis]KUJ17061.1 hypothetical protein LY89DRAFT_734052 [Mollisia scopiformis]
MSEDEIDIIDLEEFEEEFEEDIDPSLLADMANFPGKARNEVIAARRLWATNTIEIYNKNEDDPYTRRVFIARDVICSLSGRFRKLSPTSRSWPIIEWKMAVDQQWRKNFNPWAFIQDIMKYLHTFAPIETEEELFEFMCGEWTLGAAFEAPKYQNYAMKRAMSLHTAEFQVRARVYINSNEKNISIWDVVQLRRFEPTYAKEGDLNKYKLATYILDSLVWDTFAGGTLWLNMVKDGGFLAEIVATAHFEAAKKPAPRFPPWHIFNRHKYLLNEDPITPPKRAGDDMVSESGKRARYM